MRPGRLAQIDRIRADEAAVDVMGHLNAFLRGHDTDWFQPAAQRPSGWAPEHWNSWCRCVWLWECSVLGRDPLDTSPMTVDELVLLRLELL